MLIIKAMSDYWGVEVKPDKIGDAGSGGYPSIAARETATFGLAGLVAAYPDSSFDEFFDFELATRISMKVDALAMADRVSDALTFYDRLDPERLFLRPLTEDQCRAIAAAEIDEASGVLRIQDDSTQQHRWGWLYLYQSAAYLETGNFAEMVAGNAPMIVDRFTGALWRTGTTRRPNEYVDAYVARGAPMLA